MSDDTEKGRSRKSSEAYLLIEEKEGKKPGWWRLWLLFGAGAMIAAIVTLTVFQLKKQTTPNDWPTNFQNDISAGRISDFLKYYTSVAHVAGTTADYATAIYTRDSMLTAGIPQVDIEEYQVLLTSPISRSVKVVSPVENLFTASLTEATYSEDPSSTLPIVDTFLGYSASGTVTGELVFVNYGQPQDYDTLQQLGIDVAGKIVIVKYGRMFRGNKVSEAAARGAAAVLIYSDPSDDGANRGATYPQGTWKPVTGVQRGSVWVGSGDPLTIGVPATAAAPRINYTQAKQDSAAMDGMPLPNIPAVPLSAQDAEGLMKGLNLNIAPESWKGGLNIPYYITGTQTVEVAVVMNHTVTPIWNVIGKIPGEFEPDRVILIGNHRDAWTFGATDPSSGTAVLMELAVGLGRLYKQGWRPRRSVWLCSWDGEEQGLIGSTEFAEQHEKMLLQQAVFYMNVDIAVAGGPLLFINGMPSLTEVVEEVTESIPALTQDHPKYHTLYDNWNATGETILSAAPMGSSSDYGSFIQHLGIASLDTYWETEDDDGYLGVYHSKYDTYYTMINFIDPQFARHAAVVDFMSQLLFHFTEEEILPFVYSPYAEVIHEAVDELKDYAKTQAPQLDFSSLDSAIGRFASAVHQLDEEREEAVSGEELTPFEQRILNDKLFLLERAFLAFQGISGRSWSRHIVWVESTQDNYASSAFAAISDAIAVNDLTSAQSLIQLSSVIVDQAANFALGQG